MKLEVEAQGLTSYSRAEMMGMTLTVTKCVLAFNQCPESLTVSPVPLTDFAVLVSSNSARDHGVGLTLNFKIYRIYISEYRFNFTIYQPNSCHVGSKLKLERDTTALHHVTLTGSMHRPLTS